MYTLVIVIIAKTYRYLCCKFFLFSIITRQLIIGCLHVMGLRHSHSHLVIKNNLLAPYLSETDAFSINLAWEKKGSYPYPKPTRKAS